MDRGTYITASGGLHNLRQLEMINNNLANITTPGFKGQYLISSSRSFDDTLASQMGVADETTAAAHEATPEVVTLEAYTDFSPGPIEETGNPLDVALRNSTDFFVINTPDGQQFTRAGNFTLNAEGALVTKDGMEVQGDGGTITVTGSEASISSSGEVLAGSARLGRLQVVRFDNPQELEFAGNTRFRLPEGKVPGETVAADLVPQSLEMSNVSAVHSMIEQIGANRAFELYTKTARTIDEMNNLAISKVGKRT